MLARRQVDLQPVLDMIARMAGELSGAENCLLWLVDGDLLHVRGAFGGKPGTLEYERAHPHRGDETHTLTGRVVQRREVVGIPDVLADENYRWGSQTIQGFRALLGVPILADDELLGVLGISWAEPQIFTDHQVQLVSGRSPTSICERAGLPRAPVWHALYGLERRGDVRLVGCLPSAHSVGRPALLWLPSADGCGGFVAPWRPRPNVARRVVTKPSISGQHGAPPAHIWAIPHPEIGAASRSTSPSFIAVVASKGRIVNG